MPSLFGLDFVQNVLANKGKAAAYAGMLLNLHRHSPDHAAGNLSAESGGGAPNHPISINWFAPGYQHLISEHGRFDVTASQQYGASDPKNISPWRGAITTPPMLRLLRRSDCPDDFFRGWDSPEAARAFAKLWADYWPSATRKRVCAAGLCPMRAPQTCMVFILKKVRLSSKSKQRPAHPGRHDDSW